MYFCFHSFHILSVSVFIGMFCYQLFHLCTLNQTNCVQPIFFFRLISIYWPRWKLYSYFVEWDILCTCFCVYADKLYQSNSERLFCLKRDKWTKINWLYLLFGLRSYQNILRTMNIQCESKRERVNRDIEKGEDTKRGRKIRVR